MSAATVTVDSIMALHPCRERSQVEALAQGRTEASALDLLRLPALGWADCLWVLRGAKLIPNPIWQLWAIDCAKRALPLYEQRHPDDKRPREALVAASAYLLGEITLDELRSKRAAAADAAAYAAFYAAAAADDDAYYAAYAAYYAADYAAAAAAAAADARQKERCWQREHLTQLVAQMGGAL